LEAASIIRPRLFATISVSSTNPLLPSFAPILSTPPSLPEARSKNIRGFEELAFYPPGTVGAAARSKSGGSAPVRRGVGTEAAVGERERRETIHRSIRPCRRPRTGTAARTRRGRSPATSSWRTRRCRLAPGPGGASATGTSPCRRPRCRRRSAGTNCSPVPFPSLSRVLFRLQAKIRAVGVRTCLLLSCGLRLARDYRKQN
jgi:hypothetical protein